MSGTETEMSSVIENDNINYLSNAYKMFVFSIRSEVTRKYYERRLRHFFNHIKFDMENNKNMKTRCNNFCLKGRNDSNWAIEQVITFLQFQRVQNGSSSVLDVDWRNIALEGPSIVNTE